MMTDQAALLELVFEAIREMNAQFPERKIKVEGDAPLYGRGGTLDSLGLVNLIVAVEQLVETKLGVSVSLADERALSQKKSPFATANTLAEYLRGILSEQTHG